MVVLQAIITENWVSMGHAIHVNKITEKVKMINIMFRNQLFFSSVIGGILMKQ